MLESALFCLFLVVVLPMMAYLIVKLGTLGYLRARSLHDQKPPEQD